jgi:hypothetical protein
MIDGSRDEMVSSEAGLVTGHTTTPATGDMHQQGDLEAHLPRQEWTRGCEFGSQFDANLNSVVHVRRVL